MKHLAPSLLLLTSGLWLFSCGPGSIDGRINGKALADSTVKASIKHLSGNEPGGDRIQARHVETQNRFDKEKPVDSYDWKGEYSGESNYVGYFLKVTSEAPQHWAEFGWELEATGIQTYYKLGGYALRNDRGGLDFYFTGVTDGVFYEEAGVDPKKVLFALQKKGDLFRPVDGSWKVTGWVTTFQK